MKGATMSFCLVSFFLVGGREGQVTNKPSFRAGLEIRVQGGKVTLSEVNWGKGCVDFFVCNVRSRLQNLHENGCGLLTKNVSRP